MRLPVDAKTAHSIATVGESNQTKPPNHSLAVVIVSYDSAGELAACVRAVDRAARQTNLASHHVVVIDNHSHDKSVSVASRLNVATIENKTNKGFASAVNQGISYAFKMYQSDLLLILNPDCFVAEASITELIKMFDSTPDCAAVGPRYSGSTGEISEEYYLRVPSWLSVVLFSTVLRIFSIKKAWLVERFYNVQLSSSTKEVPMMPGACLLTSAAVLADVGLLDEDYAIWFEDVDWSVRAVKKGYSLLYCDAAEAEHSGGVSFGKWQSSDKTITFYVSMKTFFSKQRPLSYGAVVATLCLNALILWLKNHRRSNFTLIKALLFSKKGVLPE